MGRSVLNPQNNTPWLDIGADYVGKANYDVDYTAALRFKPHNGTEVLAAIKEPYLLYATPIQRGEAQVIEELIPIYNTEVEVDLPVSVKKAYTIPGNKEVKLDYSAGIAKAVIPEFTAHIALVLEETCFRPNTIPMADGPVKNLKPPGSRFV